MLPLVIVKPLAVAWLRTARRSWQWSLPGTVLSAAVLPVLAGGRPAILVRLPDVKWLARFPGNCRVVARLRRSAGLWTKAIVRL
ncbi:MAG TPA: hypothetical protein VMA95_09845 [Streptosporangiaceae bacterium]|nr:hypothetical protein [Streptosporangiaceae bacterium]